MTTPEQNVADAVRIVAMRLEEALERGKRSRLMDANDVLETLLSIADALDPPVREPDGEPDGDINL